MAKRIRQGDWPFLFVRTPPPLGLSGKHGSGVCPRPPPECSAAALTLLFFTHRVLLNPHARWAHRNPHPTGITSVSANGASRGSRHPHCMCPHGFHTASLVPLDKAQGQRCDC